MRISAKVDYAVRAAVELAAAGNEPIKGEAISEAQGIPLKFLENILGELKHTGIVASRRGARGGYWLAKPADEIVLAEIVRAVEGPLATVRGQGPETLEYRGEAEPLQKVWIAVRANLRAIMYEVTLADVVSGKLPAGVMELSEPAEAWSQR
jgi:Rrf2 family protein